MRNRNFLALKIKLSVILVSTSWSVFANTKTFTSEKLETADSTPKQVEIFGSKSEVDARRDSIAGKIIIGRKSIEESGVSTAADLLKRHPAVTVSSNGKLGLMGMPGHTQILIDGIPAIGGKDPLELDVVHIENIEIVRSAVAEFGPFGSAGTINIVSRKINRRTTNSLRSSIAGGPQGSGADIAWSTSMFETGSPYSYAAQVSLGKSRQHKFESSSLSAQGGGNFMTLVERNATDRREDVRKLLASSTFAWQRDTENKFSVEPSAFVMLSESTASTASAWLPTDRGPSASSEISRSPLHSFSLPLKWELTLPKRAALTLTFSPTRFSYRKDLDREETFVSLPPRSQQNLQGSDRRTDVLRANYSRRLEQHALKAGITQLRNREDTEYRSFLNGLPDASLNIFGTSKTGTDDKISIFAQDEWRFSKLMSINLGISAERRKLDMNEGIFKTRIRYSVISPSANITWRQTTDAKDQIRLGIARTFNSPFNDQLSARPTINVWSPCPAAGLCGANTPDFADTVGNPGLRPERAIGLNLSFEHYIGEDSVITVELFDREFKNAIGKHLQLMPVPWADSPRYVIRPENLGTAWSRGIGLEAQINTAEVWKGMPKIEVRGAVSFAISRISLVPGPDNRVAGQSPWTVKLGTGYGFAVIPLKIGFDMNLSPAVWTRSSEIKRDYKNQRFDLGFDGSWTVDPKTKLRFNIDHLISSNLDGSEQLLDGDGTILLRSASRTVEPKIGLKLEQSF